MIFRYPALVTGTPHGFRKPRLCVVVREIDLGIMSLTAYEAPVAALLRTKQTILGQQTIVELPVRYIEGRFYIPGEVDRQALPGLLSDPFLECPIRHDLFRMFRSKVPPYEMEREGMWPRGIGLYLTLGSKSPEMEDIAEKSRSVVLTEEGQSQAALVDATAEGMSSHYLIVDGTLWRRVPEPAFVAELASGRVMLEIADVYDVVPGRTAGSIVFPVTAYDEVVAALRVFGDADVTTSPTAHVFIPEAFSSDFHDVNYARFARHLASGQRAALAENDLPRVFNQIDKMTSARVDRIDFEQLEELVDQALRENERLLASGSPDSLVGMDRRLRDFHLDLWEGRIVDLAAVLPTGPRLP